MLRLLAPAPLRAAHRATPLSAFVAALLAASCGVAAPSAAPASPAAPATAFVSSPDPSATASPQPQVRLPAHADLVARLTSQFGYQFQGTVVNGVPASFWLDESPGPNAGSIAVYGKPEITRVHVNSFAPSALVHIERVADLLAPSAQPWLDEQLNRVRDWQHDEFTVSETFDQVRIEVSWSETLSIATADFRPLSGPTPT